VLRANNHANSFASETTLDEISNSLSHPFLDLRTTRNLLDDAGKLAESGDSTIGNISNMSDPSEWEQMVLTHARKRYIPNKHNFVIAFLKRHLQMTARVE
jgi:hypothetical protein